MHTLLQAAVLGQGMACRPPAPSVCVCQEFTTWVVLVRLAEVRPAGLGWTGLGCCAEI
ncbi:hypothetical protein BDQ94DRAFT_135588 [Aspergillus welwitschiae]|uniref:Uncharacterized protein n=1 Tax=Aspergillus welwitschiae TaxID=1341132 RepID=A0A3F3QFL4_9EURO|nr:hypothetical protein BDQ94DRAFT_135588 [Aspergillus welwitschiae]RDH38058.1 hypothetical protein BDQ94DRAFT_135588 [Aspergillus welwitschiae]